MTISGKDRGCAAAAGAIAFGGGVAASVSA